MRRLLIVSNRLPVNIEFKNNKLEFQSSVGGVATGLSGYYKSQNCVWIGWPGITKEKFNGNKEEINNRLVSEGFQSVILSKRDVENYYHGFCNKTIWPLFHYFTQYTTYDRKMWDSYKRVNEAFCDAVLKVAKPNDVIWVQDYHLFLLPQMLREKLPDATIGFFLHIPFPSFEIFRLLPWRNKILKGLLGADQIGFHTFDYARHALHSISRLLGYENDFGQITVGDRKVKVDTFPMGINYDQYAKAGASDEVQKEIKKIRKNVGERKIILSIDRLDYSKGIPQRLEAYDHFLKKHPEFKEKVTLILVAVPSRTQVEHYKKLKSDLEEMISGVNGRHGTIGWTPVWYLYRMIPFDTLAALYKIADVALITPLRDGMNLMAKEFIASKGNEKGVLILSEMAGAAAELGEALIVNPNNKNDMARAIKDALTMSCDEQRARNRIMQKRLQRYDVVHWAKDFTEKLYQMKTPEIKDSIKVLTGETKTQLIKDYSNSNERLILLDYDGTLVPFADQPEKATPNDEVMSMLKGLSREEKNEVIIVSGRDKETLENWFGKIDIGLIAEHGAWLKERGSTWETINGLENDWKNEIKPLLEQYVDRTPGAFIEEKDFSLAWHYRKADQGLSSVRSRELKDALLHLTINHNLEVLEGAKVIEVRNAGVNKGQTAQRWLSKNGWDYILAIGDDVTDEDVFTQLPTDAYSIKVGMKPTKAKFNLRSVVETHKLLKDLK